MVFTLNQTVSASFWNVSGDVMLRDPSIIKEGNTWWAFGTGEVDKNGLRVLRSDNETNWSTTPVIFTQPLSW